MKDIVDRLEDMANGWLCAGLHDADLPAEGALEIVRLRSLANDTHDELSELREDCAALRKDAERYRWLRHGDNDERGAIKRPGVMTFLLRTGLLDLCCDEGIEEDKTTEKYTRAAPAVGCRIT